MMRYHASPHSDRSSGCWDSESLSFFIKGEHQTSINGWIYNSTKISSKLMTRTNTNVILGNYAVRYR